MRSFWILAAIAAAVALALVFLAQGSGEPTERPEPATRDAPVAAVDAAPEPPPAPVPVETSPDHERVPVAPRVEAGSELGQGVRGGVVGPGGAPLPGIDVYLVESADNNPFAQWQAMQHGVPLLPAAQTATDPRGAFALGIRQAAQKRYEVRVLSDAHADARIGPLQIQQGDWYDAGRIQLLPGSVVRGRVTIAGTTLPAPQAVVTMVTGNMFEDAIQASLPGREQGLRTLTDQDGHYELKNAPRQGFWTMHAVAPGFARATKSQIELDPERQNQIDFELHPGLVIQGRVTDAAAQPVAAARVQALALQRDGAVLEAFTARDGTFEVIGLQEGPQRLRVTARGFQARDEQPVAAGATGVHLILETTGTARARVRTADGRILGRYLLGVRRWFANNGGQIGSVPSVPDASVRPEDLVDGAASVTGLERGSYVFQVQAEGFAKALSEPFEIGPEQTAPLLEVTLTQGTSLVGTVVDEWGRPIADAEVVTQAAGTAEHNPFHRLLSGLTPDKITRATVRTGAQGTFRIERLASADYQLKVSHADYCDALVRDVALAGEGERRLEPVLLRRGALVLGRVTVDGVPSGQVRVVAGPPMADAQRPDLEGLVRCETVSNNDGTFAMPKRLPPGNYEIKAAEEAGGGQDIFRQLVQFKQTAAAFSIGPAQQVYEHRLNIVTQR